MAVPLIGQNEVACFCRQSIVVPYQTTKNDALKNAINWAGKKRWLVWVIRALCTTRLEKLERNFSQPHLIIESQLTKTQNHP